MNLTSALASNRVCLGRKMWPKICVFFWHLQRQIRQNVFLLDSKYSVKKVRILNQSLCGCLIVFKSGPILRNFAPISPKLMTCHDFSDC